ncbi:hypothetical protein ACTZWW_07020 [Salinarimonas sp. NSM]|uniref:hypothetical protein n=1 Tax=Salinarimonas sp. NSM TaxID=3458003 RepID=UPI004035C350
MTSGRPPGFEENAAFEDEPVLAPRVPVVLRTAREAGHFGGVPEALRIDVDAKLLATVRRLTGITDGSELLTFALAHVAWDADWLLDFQASRGTLDPDIDLDLS